MSDLKIDLSELDGLYRNLVIASSVLSSIAYTTEQMKAAVGHHNLQNRVGDFSRNWDHTRTTMIDAMDSMWAETKAVVEAFTQADQQLGAALKGG